MASRAGHICTLAPAANALAARLLPAREVLASSALRLRSCCAPLRHLLRWAPRA
jgi:hypothetical protein